MQKYNYNIFEMPAEKVIDIYNMLLKKSIPAWLDGGWAVDALAQNQTRHHQDVDFLIPIEYTNQLINLFLNTGYLLDEQETEFPYRLVVLLPEDKIMVDFHLVIPQEDGSMVFRITNYKEKIPSYNYVYSVEGLEGVGLINGFSIPCITLEEQIRCRTLRNYSFDDSDRIRPGNINADRHDLSVIEDLKKQLRVK